MKFVFCLFLILGASNVKGEELVSDFLNLCKATLKNKAESLPICDSLQEKFFSKNKSSSIVALLPKDVGAESSPIDNKIHFFIFNDPNDLSGMAYCYFTYRNWIRGNETSPDILGASASGFSILNENIKEYQTWLSSSSEGQRCKSRVEKESEVSVANLETLLKGKVGLIGLNPYALIQANNITLSSVLNEMMLTINHERIHAYQAACPEFDKWSLLEWEKLPVVKKNEYIKKYPSYNWTIPKIAAREYVGFLYETTPNRIDEHVKNCKIK